MQDKKFTIKYTLRTNGDTWYLIDTRGNVVSEVTDLQVNNLIK